MRKIQYSIINPNVCVYLRVSAAENGRFQKNPALARRSSGGVFSNREQGFML
jgi:hypothetical protein